MKTIHLDLRVLNNVRRFVSIANQYPYSIQLQSGHYIVDGKSMLGIFSLDLTKTIDAVIGTCECEDLLKDLGELVVA